MEQRVPCCVLRTSFRALGAHSVPLRPCRRWQYPQRPFSRSLQTSAEPSKIPDLAFVFDIDGVLVRGSKRLPGATETLSYLRQQQIPFILLTNGGGILERTRAELLSHELKIPIHTQQLVQSHTPFAGMDEYKDGTALIVGGESTNCRTAAHEYGFKRVVTPSQIFKHHPEIWPFSSVFRKYHDMHPPADDQVTIDPSDLPRSLKIDSIFVYNDPRDWGLDLTIIIDCLLSKQGYLGTLSDKNNRPDLPNRGYQQDGQPPLFFSNPDLWFASEFLLPRLGQGGFQAALEGVWTNVTGGAANGVELKRQVFGKPSQGTYVFAEKQLDSYRRTIINGKTDLPPLKKIYMIGDNPASDIQGASTYQSPFGTSWSSALLRSGVYAGGEPAWKPTIILDDVQKSVQWAVKDAGWVDI